MRWWNKFPERLAARGRAAGKQIRFALIGKRGVRLGWKLLAAGFLYALWAHLGRYGLILGFSKLFEVWNLDATTLERAPGWAQFLAAEYGAIVSILLGLGTMGLAALLIRLLCRGRIEGMRIRDLCGGTLLGAAAAIVPALIFLWTDSMRPYSSLPDLNAEIFFMLPVFFLSAWAQEWFARSLAMQIIGDRVPRWAGRLIAVIFFLAVADGYTYGPLGTVNMALVGMFLLLLHEKKGAGAAVGFYFAWSYGFSTLLAFPGGTAVSRPLFQLYSVSENFLTGGEGGMICGFAATLILLAGNIYLAEILPLLKEQIHRISKKNSEKKMRPQP